MRCPRRPAMADVCEVVLHGLSAGYAFVRHGVADAKGATYHALA